MYLKVYEIMLSALKWDSHTVNYFLTETYLYEEYTEFIPLFGTLEYLGLQFFRMIAAS